MATASPTPDDALTSDEGLVHVGHERRQAILAVLCLSLFMIVLGNTVLNVAIPRLIADLDASTTQLQWMVDSYSLVFAGLLLTGGALGDRFGRKGFLQLGLVLFALGSGLSAVATSANQLIATRALMGVAAALVMPATLSILTNVFPAHERGRAIGVWAGVAGAAGAVGPITTGVLLEHYWWGSVFLVNLVVVAVALVSGAILVPTSRDPAQPPLDPVGAVLSVLGMGAVLYAIIEAPNHGWLSARTLAFFAVGVVLLMWFGYYETTTDHPMLDIVLFRDARFSAAAGAITMVFFALFGTFFLSTQYFQLVRGYSPLETGVRLLPMAVTMMVVAPTSARVVEKVGSKRVVTFGLGMVGIGLLLFSRCDVDTPYLAIVGCLMFIATGMASTMAPATGSIMSAVPLGKAGVGSAVNDTTRELGGSLGVAVLGSILASRYAEVLTGAPEPARKSLGAALQIGGEGSQLATLARDAYVSGASRALVVGGLVSLAGAWFVHRYLPGLPQAQGSSSAVWTSSGAGAMPVRGGRLDGDGDADGDAAPSGVPA